jgi:hypothetical protein
MSPAQARRCLMARGAIKTISPVPGHHAVPHCLSRPEKHEKYRSAKASAAANPGCRCPRSCPRRSCPGCIGRAEAMAMIIRAQLFGPDNHIVPDSQYNELLTMHARSRCCCSPLDPGLCI